MTKAKKPFRAGEPENPAEWAEYVAHELRGTCETLEGALGPHDQEDLENDVEFCDRLDELVFKCSGCAWWFDCREDSRHKEALCGSCGVAAYEN